MLTNHIVSFEQLDPDVWKNYDLIGFTAVWMSSFLSYKRVFGGASV